MTRKMNRSGLGREDRVNIAMYKPLHKRLRRARAMHELETGEALTLVDAVEEAVDLWLRLQDSNGVVDHPLLAQVKLESVRAFTKEVDELARQAPVGDRKAGFVLHIMNVVLGHFAREAIDETKGREDRPGEAN